MDIALGLRGAEGDKFPGSSIIERPFVVLNAAQGSRVLWELYREVMDAVNAGKIEGIVTNWGNPLQGFNRLHEFHTDTQFYTSAFLIIMNRGRYESYRPT